MKIKNTIISNIVITIISEVLYNLCETIIDCFITPVINIDRKKIIKINNNKLKSGEFLFNLLKSIIIIYIVYLLFYLFDKK